MTLAFQNRVSKIIPNHISYPPFHQLRCQKQMSIDAVPIISNQQWFHTHSFLLLSDGIIWYILSTAMIIHSYDMSLIYFHGFGLIESAGVGLFYGVITFLNINLFMVFTNVLWRRGSRIIQMVLYIARFIDEFINEFFWIMYGLRTEMWYIIIKLYLMNNKILHVYKFIILMNNINPLRGLSLAYNTFSKCTTTIIKLLYMADVKIKYLDDEEQEIDDKGSAPDKKIQIGVKLFAMAPIGVCFLVFIIILYSKIIILFFVCFFVYHAFSQERILSILR
eukprot:216925_1